MFCTAWVVTTDYSLENAIIRNMKKPERLKLCKLKDEIIKEKVNDMIKETAKETDVGKNGVRTLWR